MDDKRRNESMKSQEIVDKFIELYDDSQNTGYFGTPDEQIIDEFNEFKEKMIAICVRYFALEDRYQNWNEKHFGELCGTYFDDFPLTFGVDG